MKAHLVNLVIIILFSVFAMKALFHPGLYTAHDIWHQVARLYYYHEGILDGQFPPYWIGTLANGYGYPLFFFSYHLPWITALPLLFAGLEIPATLKALFVISYIASAISMYFFINDLLKSRWAALVSALIYNWAPYHFVTILVSAAIGVAFVFIFAPLLLWGLYKIANRPPDTIGIVITAIAIAAIILSHFLAFVLLLPFVFLFAIWLVITQKQGMRRTIIKHMFIASLIGIGLAAFYVLPGVYYSRYTQTAHYFHELYQKNFVNLSQLIYSRWGYGIADTAKQMLISFQIGIAQWISIVGTVVLLLFSLSKKKFTGVGRQLIEKTLYKRKLLAVIIFGGFTLSVFLMIDASRPIWDLVTRFISLDYPTSFLITTTLTGSIAAGFVIAHIKPPLQFSVMVFIITIAFYTNRNHLRVNMYTDIPVEMYVASEITTNSFHEYLPQTASTKLFEEPNLSVVISPRLTPENVQQGTQELSFDVTVPQTTDMTIRQIAFPGVTLYLNNQKSEFTLDKLGRIKTVLPAGTSQVLVRFIETPLIVTAKIVTIGTAALLFFLVYKRYA